MTGHSSRLVRSIWLLLFLFLLPATAEAHSDLRLGAFAGGILHPVETPAHILLLIALGVFLGQHPPARLRLFITLFGLLAAVALIATVIGDIPGVPQPLLFSLAFCTGALISAGFKPPVWVYLALVIFSAAGIGLDSGVFNPSAMIVGKVLFATWVALLVIVGYIAFYVSLLPQRKWAQIGVRILGSWIVATAVLILAFYLKRG